MMRPQGDLVTVASFPDALQAHLARGRLEAEGIPALVADEYYVSANWMMSNAIGGVKVQVGARMAERARSVLAQLDAGEFEVEDAEHPAERCPRCGAAAIETSAASWRVAILGLHLLQLPLPFRRSRRACRRCGWRDES